MRRTIFSILIGVALLLTLAVCPLAFAESSAPQLERVLPVADEYIEFNSLLMADFDENLAVIDRITNEDSTVDYLLNVYEGGKIKTSINTGGVMPVKFELYNDHAFLLLRNQAVLTVYSLATKEKVTTVALPQTVENFTIDNATLYVKNGANLELYDLTNLDAITLLNSFTPEYFSNTSAFTVWNKIVYFEDTVSISNEQNVYAFDTTSGEFLQNEHIAQPDGSNIYIKKITLESSDGSTAFCTQLATDGDYLYMLYPALSSKSVQAYSFLTGARKTPSLYTRRTNHVSVNDKLVFLSSSENNTIDVYRMEYTKLEYVRSYTTASTSTIDPQPGRFNSPYSIYNHSNDHVIITDTKNHRILIYDNDYNLKKKVPIYGPMEAVGNYSTGYVLTSDNQIAYYYPGESGADHISYAEFDNLKFNNPKSLTLNKSGKAYFIDAGNDRVISASTTGEQTVFEKFNIPTPLALSIATGGDVVYAIYSNKIVAYDYNATELFVFDLTETLNKNLENVYDVDTDVNGNIFILTNSNLIILDRSWQGYNFRSQTTLTIDGVDAYCSSITVNSQGMVHLTGNKLSTENEHGHCIYELNNAGANVYNPDDYVIPDYTTKECLSEPAKYIKVAQDNVYVFDYKNNFESARTITKDTILLLLDNEPHDGLYFVYYNNKPGFLPEVYATVYQANLNKYQALALYDSPVYKYPVKSDDFKLDTLPKDTKFDVVSDAFGFSSIHENKTIYWYQIELNGQIYYIERAAVGETEIEVNKDYGKAKLRASAINTTIKLYNRPKQDNAYVIAEFKDGTEVQLLEEFPTEKEFIHVYVEGVGDGYVLTSEIDTGGMTPGQIVLLVLIVLGGTASVVTLVISRKMYRKR